MGTAVIQVTPVVFPGDYQVVVGGAGSTTGTYTLEVLLNAAVESERYGGPANNTLVTAQNLEPTFVDLGLGSARRGAVVGRGDNVDGSPRTTLSQTQYNNVYSPNLLTYQFADAPQPLGNATLTISAIADLGSRAEYLALDVEGLFSTDLFVIGGSERSFVSTTVSLSQSQVETMLADDGLLTFTITPGSAVNNTGPNELTLQLEYAVAPTTDYYQFDLTAGQSATLAHTSLSGPSGTLQLLDSGGNLLSTSLPAGGADQVIHNFVSDTGGTYFVRVDAIDSLYSLLVTKNADFDDEPNNSAETSQRPRVCPDRAGQPGQRERHCRFAYGPSSKKTCLGDGTPIISSRRNSAITSR